MKMEPIQFIIENEMVFLRLDEDDHLMLELIAANDGGDPDFDESLHTMSKVWCKDVRAELTIRIHFVDILADFLRIYPDSLHNEKKRILESLRDHCQVFINRIDEVMKERS